MKPYVSHLNSTAKGSWDFDLEPLTLIHGDNGHGKTGILTALRLALEGEDERLGKTGVELLKLLSGGEGELYAEATISGLPRPADARFSVKGTLARASKPVHVIRGAERPVGAVLNGIVRGVMAKGAKLRRETILRVVAPADCLSQAVSHVPEAFKGDWARTVELARAKLIEDAGPLRPGEEFVEADVVVSAAELLREKLRLMRKAAKKDLGDRPAGPSDADLARLRESVSKVQAIALALGKRDTTRSRLLELRAQLAALPDGDRSGLPDKAKLAERRKLVEAFKVVLAAHNERLGYPPDGDGHCFLCGAHWMDSQDDGGFNLAAEEEKLGKDEARIKESGVRPADKLAAEIERLETVEREALQVLPESARGLDAAAVSARLTGLLAELNDLDVRAQRVREWDDARAGQVDAEMQLVALEALKKAADRVVEQSLSKSLGDFCTVASAPLGDLGSLSVKLHDGRRQVCEILLHKPSGERVAWETLCGAEEALALSGLATAWASKVEAPVKLVAVDDVWMGKRALLALLGALRDALERPDGPTQAIVCAVELPGEVLRLARDLGAHVLEV